MKVKTDADVNGASARVLRVRLKLSQKEFWGGVGVSQPAGSQYESGKTIPLQVRKLLFLKYVVGINIDAPAPGETQAA